MNLPSLNRRIGSVLATGLAALWVCAASAQVPGITEPINDVTVSARIPGTIAKIPVKEGDFVEEGRLVIEMEKQQEELEVRRRKLLWDGKAELQAAAAQMEMLKIDVEGTRRLFESTKSVSKEQLLKKELEYKQAVAEHDKLSLSETREGIEYEMAQEQLRQRMVTSPLAGYIVELFRKAGEDCKAQEPLVRIVDTRRCYFVANLEAKPAAGLRAGQPVKLEIEAGNEKLAITGSISFVSSVVDPASGLLKVKVLFDNPDGKIHPGVAGVMQLPKP